MRNAAPPGDPAEKRREAETPGKGTTDRPLERYVRILEVVAGFSGGIGLPRLAEVLDLPKTTVHRLVRSLVDTGMLAASEAGAGTYALGPRFARLAYSGTPDSWIQSISHTLLKDLADQTDQACFVAKLTDHRIRSVAMVAPDNPVRSYVIPGRELWPHAAASAKAILAFQSEAVMCAVLPTPLPRLTEHTKTRIKDLQAEFATVRRDGIAFCIGEDIDGCAGIACPIDIEGLGVLYSVGITGTVETLINRKREPFEKHLRACAAKLTRAIEARLLHGAAAD